MHFKQSNNALRKPQGNMESLSRKADDKNSARLLANPPFTLGLRPVCLLYNNKIMLTVKTANISVLFTHFIYSLKVALILPLCLRCSLLRRGFNWLRSFAQRPRSCSKIPYKIRHVKCSVACEQALLAG